MTLVSGWPGKPKPLELQKHNDKMFPGKRDDGMEGVGVDNSFLKIVSNTSTSGQVRKGRKAVRSTTVCHVRQKM